MIRRWPNRESLLYIDLEGRPSRMFLRDVRFVDLPDERKYPFNLPVFRTIQQLDFNQFLTFFVGENGSGKSTLLEAGNHFLTFSRVG